MVCLYSIEALHKLEASSIGRFWKPVVPQFAKIPVGAGDALRLFQLLPALREPMFALSEGKRL